jgi:serine/threonine-protein kinase
MLTHWQAEPDLTGLREPSALAELSADERKECHALWDEVGVVLQRVVRQERAALDPKYTNFLDALRNKLTSQGRLEEARTAWGATLESANPLDHNAWFGYAELCLFLGREDEYRRARRTLLARFGSTTNPYFAERTGRACLLRPATGDELRQAVAVTERAAAAAPSADAWATPWFLFARGLAEYRQERFDRAIATLQGDASRLHGPNARLVLAMALHRGGHPAEAKKTLAAAILSYDWRGTQARNHDAWICHVLRREAQGVIVPNLPDFWAGEYQPRDSDERLALLSAQMASCQFRGLYRAAARLYSDVFVAEPKLAESVVEGVRFNAARTAVLAGCGQGQDAGKLDDQERAHLRRQALDWLRQDLTWWSQALDHGNTQTKAQVRPRMQQWRGDPDLAGVRAKDALGKLGDEERERWERLWSDADALQRRASAPE